MTEIETVAFHVTGRVQGVSFRAWTAREAEARGLSGWVRNEPDGSVRGVLSGEGDAVRDMVEALGLGPRLASVREVRTGPGEMPSEAGFRIVG